MACCSLPYIDIISRDLRQYYSKTLRRILNWFPEAAKKDYQPTCDTIYANHFSISFETAPDAPFSYRSGVTVTKFPDLSLLLLLV